MAGKAKARRKGARTQSAPSSVTIRHYCQGIGDCHLLTFAGADGKPFRILIDCGVHSSVTGGAEKIDRIVSDLAKACAGRIDVLVITHEHWDHISGFVSAAEKFKKLKIGAIWMGWTENPDDPQARQLDTFKGIALAALDGAQDALKAAGGGTGELAPHLNALREGLGSVLGFHGIGIKGERVRSAREAAAALAKGKERYLEPGGRPIQLPSLPNLRIYVLGPPRDAKELGIRERAGEMYGLGGRGGWPMATAMESALRAASDSPGDEGDWAAPFEPNVGATLARQLAARSGTKSAPDERVVADILREHYASHREAQPEEEKQFRGNVPAWVTDERWRRIDHDWLGLSADLAIQLDDRTNNSSLVLAFEFIDSGRVLLFTGDAQVGSWLSWQDLKWKIGDKVVTGPDLLARTVYYKVGHHGSHNATLKQKGLELMNDPDLSAFIPTNKKDARKVKWGEMPFAKIVDALNLRAQGRVIRADDPWVATDKVDQRFTKKSGSIQEAAAHEKNLYVEVVIA